MNIKLHTKNHVSSKDGDKFNLTQQKIKHKVSNVVFVADQKSIKADPKKQSSKIHDKQEIQVKRY